MPSSMCKPQELKEKYGITKTISFSFKPEWFDIVDSALSQLSKLPQWHPDKVVQVKQKFDFLRIYLDGDLAESIEAKAIVNEAEIAAYKLPSSNG